MESVEKKGNAQENLNTVLGSIGTAGVLGLLGGNGLNLFGNRQPVGDPPWARDMNYERQLTQADAKIGKLEAQIYCDQQVNELRRELQTAVQAQQVFNATMNASVATTMQQTQQLMKLTGLYINQPTMAASEAALADFRNTSGAATTGTGN